jgi:hypothetical protein
MAARNYAAELRQNLKALTHLAPSQYMAEATLAPLYAGLQLQQMDTLLNGTGPQTFTSYDWQKPIYQDASGNQSGFGKLPFFDIGGGGSSPFGMPGISFGGDGGGVPNPMAWFKQKGVKQRGPSKGFSLPGLGGGGGGLPGIGGLFGGGDDDEQVLVRKGFWKPQTQSRGPQRGLLDIYTNDVTPALARMQSMTREADIADVARLGGASRNAIRSANPETARLLDMMNEQATSELGQGAALDPALRRIVGQTIRGRQSGTMLANGDAGAYDEALGVSMFGNDLRNQRRGFAGNVIGLNQGVYGDAFQQVLGRSSGMVPAAMSAGGQAGGIAGMVGPRLINPESGYAADIHDSNFNARVAKGIADDNNRTALTGGAMSMIGGLGGGAMGAMI